MIFDQWDARPYPIASFQVPLGHVMEGLFEATWKPIKRFFRERCNYRSDASTVMNMRAFQEAHAYVQHEYVAHSQRKHDSGIPKTADHNVAVCSCITKTSLFKVNAAGFYDEMKHYKWVDMMMEYKKGSSTTVLLHCGTPDATWLAACFCGKCTLPSTVTSARGLWRASVTQSPITDWDRKPRKVTVVKKVLADNVTDSGDTDTDHTTTGSMASDDGEIPPNKRPRSPSVRDSDADSDSNHSVTSWDEMPVTRSQTQRAMGHVRTRECSQRKPEEWENILDQE